jgi:hypothetical protein
MLNCSDVTRKSWKINTVKHLLKGKIPETFQNMLAIARSGIVAEPGCATEHASQLLPNSADLFSVSLRRSGDK